MIREYVCVLCFCHNDIVDLGSEVSSLRSQGLLNGIL